MQRVRKYFRGSGRVLAFIFIASIIWLIFDMAALRFSFNEMNSKLNREELFKREQGGSESWKRRGNVHNGGHHWGEETTKLKGIFHPPADELGKVFNADPKALNVDPKAVLKQRKRPMALNKTMAPMGKPRTELFDLNDGGVGKGNGLQAANITQELEAKAQVKENVIVRQKATGPVLRNAEVHNVEKPVEAVRLGDKKVGDAEDSKILDAGAFRVMGGQDAAKSKDALVGKDGAAVNVGAKDAAESKDDAALHVQGVVKVVEASKQAGESLDPKHTGESRDAAEAKDVRPPEHAVVAKDVGDAKADIEAFKDAPKVKDEGLAKVIVVAKDAEIVVKDKVADASKVVVKDKEVDTIKDAVKDKFADVSKVVVKDKDVDTIKDAVKDKVADAGKVEVKDKDVDTIKDAVKDKVVKDSKVIVKDSDAAKVVEKDKNAEASKVIVQGKNDVDVKIAGKAVGGSKDEGPGLATLKLDKIKEQSLENQHPDQFLKDTANIAGKLNVTNDGPNPLPANNSSAVIINKVGAAIGNKSVNAKESQVQEPVQKLNRSGAGVGHVGESENQDVKGTLTKIIRDKQANVNISSSMNADVENKQLIHHDNLNRVPGTGMHKVRALDATVRDPKAPGQFGRPLAVPKDKEQEASRRWKEGNFNVYLSDIIPLDRAIEDTRPKGCSNQLIHDDLPSTSIIICFVDEVWSTLLRSVFSVLNRSPPELIKEIILVDDFSTKDYLKDNLDEYVKQYPKVRILHLKERHGLIRARIAGANIATGDVLTFLDSHVECNVGWLEPLLEQVRVNRKKVACPVIEVISDKDMSYMTVDNFQRGIFSWPMNFGWKPIPTEVLQRNNITDMDPIKCPVMAGGLFSIDKKYFYELGTYDPGLDVWGGENMEISFKIWMCGGEIEIIPCSRVGHIFRNDNPYSFPKDRVKTVERNLARVAEVWLDDYKELFYGHGYQLLQEIKNIGDLTQQKELRKKLQCKSFKWYIDNVFPDLDAPLVRASGVIANVALGKCLALQNSNLILDACDASKVNQHFNFTWLRLIKQRDLCFAPGDKDKLVLRQCDNLNSNLRWLHKSLTAFQPSLESHFVLESIPRPTCIEVHPTHKTLRTNACNPSNPLQKWQFEKYFAP